MKMSKYIVYLIEDSKIHADETLNKLNGIASKYATDTYSIEFKWIQGTVPKEYKGEQYLFYDDSVLEQIEKQTADENTKGNKVGLLLDIMLTQEDIEESANSYYTHASISRDIYFRFKEKLPIYIVTISATFASYSDIIMGENLSKQFINQPRLVWDPIESLESDLARLFSYYQDFYK